MTQLYKVPWINSHISCKTD